MSQTICNNISRLTTDGATGPATLTQSGLLNIPDYSTGGGGPPTGPAGGALGGTYPNPTVLKIGTSNAITPIFAIAAASSHIFISFYNVASNLQVCFGEGSPSNGDTVASANAIWTDSTTGTAYITTDNGTTWSPVSSGGGVSTIGTNATDYLNVSSNVLDFTNPVNATSGLVAIGSDSVLDLSTYGSRLNYVETDYVNFANGGGGVIYGIQDGLSGIAAASNGSVESLVDTSNTLGYNYSINAWNAIGGLSADTYTNADGSFSVSAVGNIAAVTVVTGLMYLNSVILTGVSGTSGTILADNGDGSSLIGYAASFTVGSASSATNAGTATYADFSADDGLPLHGTDDSTGGIAAFQSDGSFAQATRSQITSYAGIKAGSYTATGTATSTFTVTIGVTMASTAYSVMTEATNLLSSPVHWVSNKSTTTFDVTYATGLTGAVAFDWAITLQ